MGPLPSRVAWLWLAAAAPAAAEDGEVMGALEGAKGLAVAQAQTAPAPPRTSGPAGPSHTTAPAPPRSQEPAEGTGSRGTGPAPPVGEGPSRIQPAPPGHPGYYGRDGVWYYDPLFGWAGWGLGWGFYPLYPEPPPAEDEIPSPGVVSELAFWGGPTRQREYAVVGDLAVVGDAGSFGFSLLVDGERFGGELAADAFFLSSLANADKSNTLEVVTGHAAWAPLAGGSGRLRIELGASLASWPSAPPYGSATSVGPDLGLSGRIMLLGPFGLQGYARVTPFPRLLVDLSGAVALRFGPLALTAGWRDLSLKGDDVVPSLRFAGPQFGLSLLL